MIRQVCWIGDTGPKKLDITKLSAEFVNFITDDRNDRCSKFIEVQDCHWGSIVKISKSLKTTPTI